MPSPFLIDFLTGNKVITQGEIKKQSRSTTDSIQRGIVTNNTGLKREVDSKQLEKSCKKTKTREKICCSKSRKKAWLKEASWNLCYPSKYIVSIIITLPPLLPTFF